MPSVISCGGTTSSILIGSNYEKAVASNASSQQLVNISIDGSNFGLNFPVKSWTTECRAAVNVPAFASAVLCSTSNDTFPFRPETGERISKLRVSMSFVGLNYLKTIRLSLKLNSKFDFLLKDKNSCEGCVPSSNGVFLMQFEIDPFSTASQAPVKECEFGKLYKPVDASAILNMFGASGNWDLIVSSDSSPLAVLNISIVLETTHLAFQLGGTAVPLTRWISDSSVTVDAPGLQTGVSAAGYGSRNELRIFRAGSCRTDPHCCTLTLTLLLRTCRQILRH